MKSLKPFLLSFFTMTLFAGSLQIALANQDEAVNSDLDSSHPNYEAIMYLMENGIVHGYPDGTIRPEQEINRAELLKIFVEAAAGNPETFEYNRCFDDIEILEWYTSYVCYSKAEGWVEGYEDGSFKPANSIDNIETLAMLLRTQGFYPPEYWQIFEDPFFDVSTYEWYGPSVWYAKENNIIDGDSDYFYPGTLITRGEAFEMLYRTLLYKKDLLKPIVYSDERLSFTHSGFYKRVTSDFEDDEFFDMIVLFMDEKDDGIAFIGEAEFELFQEEMDSMVVDLFEGMSGINAEDVKVKSGEITNFNGYNEFLDDFDAQAGTFIFKVDPVFGTGKGVYVAAHYSDIKTRKDLIAMFKTIVIK